MLVYPILKQFQPMAIGPTGRLGLSALRPVTLEPGQGQGHVLTRNLTHAAVSARAHCLKLNSVTRGSAVVRDLNLRPCREWELFQFHSFILL